MRLEQLAAGHLAAVLEFETVNRVYFAASIPDRGAEFFADYPARHEALLRMQEAGTDRFHVLLTETGAVAGRVNLVELDGGEAELGYRIGRDFAGRGLATEAVGRVCELARTAYGLTRLRARTSAANLGSRKVLLRNGFAQVEAPAPGPDLLFRLDL
ncbi:N-acetyltransferase [Catellatospora sp. TT07R-123]|uniref:GNAT family N-acetyltransferase n=1 Tax=Catellatospora sp. TT07R-123 TaxID=2733863 RepID=UPI001B217FB6|nr:GNAT family N-acetyltransferase [Catellatospora sp. TT07R-123]GHJ42747.1 N-acetyltransferase [Catellatospora sp. TT07R-123]